MYKFFFAFFLSFSLKSYKNRVADTDFLVWLNRVKTHKDTHTHTHTQHELPVLENSPRKSHC